MKSNIGGESKSRFRVALITVVVSMALLLLVVFITKLGEELNRETFVIEVTNDLTHDIRDVRVSGLGKAGNIGVIRSQEVRRLIVEQDVITNDLSFYWIGLSGRVANFGRPDEWTAGTNLDGLVFKVTLNKGGSVSCHDEEMALLYRFKYCR